MSTLPSAKNAEAHERRHQQREAAGRNRYAALKADYDMLVATGREPAQPPQNLEGFMQNLGHDPMAGTLVNMRASKAQYEDRWWAPSSRQGLHSDVAAKERAGGYDHRHEDGRHNPRRHTEASGGSFPLMGGGLF